MISVHHEEADEGFIAAPLTWLSVLQLLHRFTCYALATD
jgi:hypothetical protein